MTTIFYFSGSGNSLAIARDLAAELDGDVRCMAHYLKNPTEIKTDILGIIAPVHSMTLPSIVAEFIKTVRISGNPYIFCVVNMGGIEGGSLGQAKMLFNERGLNMQAGFKMLMPDNSIILPTEEQKKEAMLADYSGRVHTIAFDVKAKRNNSTTIGKMGAWMLANKLSWLTLGKFYKAKERKVDAAKCINCGTCAKVCPLDLISLVDGIPQFTNGCVSCFACAQWCPVSAISIGKLKICKKNKYTNSTVTINELYEFNHK